MYKFSVKGIKYQERPALAVDNIGIGTGRRHDKVFDEFVKYGKP